MKYLFMFLIISFILISCQEEIPQLSSIELPTNIEVMAVIEEGQTGRITITPKANNALNFHIYFQENKPTVVFPGESVNYRYTKSGKYSVNIPIVAFGKGGISNSSTIPLNLDVRNFIDLEILKKIAGNGEKKWVWDKSKPGHFGVGPTTKDFPEYYSAPANGLKDCVYDDKLVFKYDNNNNYTFELETGDKNETLINWTEVKGFFPNLDPEKDTDECHDITSKIKMSTTFSIIVEGKKMTLLTENSTLSYYSGVVKYEILELTDNLLSVKGIQEVPTGGQLVWYHKFVPENSQETARAYVGTEPYDELVWSDEFNTDGAPDTSKWAYDIGTGLGGWGNAELQYYTNRTDNVKVEGGFLKITAKKETYMGSNYTSTRMKTQDKFNFKYGKVEVRAKLPAGVGTWPAIWSLGSDFPTAGWPACGEIDIMENVGKKPNEILGTTHSPNNSGGNGRSVKTTITDATAFHTYAIVWSPTKIEFFVDDKSYGSVTNSSTLPFNKNFFLILNIAMGGTLGGVVDTTFTSSTMEIDYVKVYQ